MIGALLAALLGLAVAGTVDVPAGLDDAYAPRRVALVVGVDAYDDPALGALKFPAKDANDMGTVLRNNDAGGFDTVHVLAGEVQATTFWEAFDQATRDLGRDDLFLLFLAGHGTLGPSGKNGSALYFLPSDAELERYDLTGIAMADIDGAMQDLEARRRVLMLDACHSGSGRSTFSSEVLRWLSALRGPAPAPVTRHVSKFDARMFAADIRQPAREDDTLENGVYTHFLVEGLNGAADLDGDGLVSVRELHEHAAARTMKHTGGVQVPRIETSEVGAGALFLAGDPNERVDAENAILTGISGLPDGVSVRVNGTERGAILPPGRHRVTLTDAEQAVVDTPIRFRAGQATDIRQLLRDRGARWNIGMGAGWARSPWTPTSAAGFDVQLQPRDKGGGRPVAALAVTAGDGALPDLGHATVVSGLLSAGWRQGAAVGWGPTVGVGALGRRLGTFNQGAPLVGVGWRFDVQNRVGFVALKTDLRAAPAVASVSWLPSVTLVVGPSVRR